MNKPSHAEWDRAAVYPGVYCRQLRCTVGDHVTWGDLQIAHVFSLMNDVVDHVMQDVIDHVTQS